MTRDGPWRIVLGKRGLDELLDLEAWQIGELAFWPHPFENPNEVIRSDRTDAHAPVDLHVFTGSIGSREVAALRRAVEGAQSLGFAISEICDVRSLVTLRPGVGL